MIARYPYQKVTDPDKPAKTTITKTVYNLFDKHLSYYPKNMQLLERQRGAGDKVIVAHAQDITGQPFAQRDRLLHGRDESTGAAIRRVRPADRHREHQPSPTARPSRSTTYGETTTPARLPASSAPRPTTTATRCSRLHGSCRG